jgi:UDP-N-acetylglucosamine 2-epimerase (non-hydrolysing)
MSTQSLKLLLIAGARPNFMKVAPIIRAILSHNSRRVGDERSLDWRLVHTGQHYDEKMSDIFFKELGIPAPDINLGAGSGSHAAQTASIMSKFEPVCHQERPNWVVVVGDVNSTMACTLVAVKLGIKVAHVEAGLRSFDRTMPEEINRVVTDAVADLLLTPSKEADENLKREGVPESRIKLVGNVMIDALVSNLDKARASQVMSRLGLTKRRFVYVTLHRPSNVDERDALVPIMGELRRLSSQYPVVFPMHPRTHKMCQQFGITLNGSSGLKILEPIGYLDSLCLTENARLVLTDSGGLQEESTFFRTPCLTLRPNTERPITVNIGSNLLTSARRLPADVGEVLSGKEELGQVPPLWDGKTADRILQTLVQLG